MPAKTLMQIFNMFFGIMTHAVHHILLTEIATPPPGHVHIWVGVFTWKLQTSSQVKSQCLAQPGTRFHRVRTGIGQVPWGTKHGAALKPPQRCSDTGGSTVHMLLSLYVYKWLQAQYVFYYSVWTIIILYIIICSYMAYIYKPYNSDTHVGHVTQYAIIVIWWVHIVMKAS